MTGYASPTSGVQDPNTSTVRGAGGAPEPSTGSDQNKGLLERMGSCAQTVLNKVANRAWSAGKRMGDWGKWTLMGPGYMYLGLIGLPVIAYLLVDRTLKVTNLEKEFNAIGWGGVIAAAGYSWSRVLPLGFKNTFNRPEETTSKSKA